MGFGTPLAQGETAGPWLDPVFNFAILHLAYYIL